MRFPILNWGFPALYKSIMICTMDQLPAYVSGIVALLLLTSFVKILTTLNILRFGIGLHSGGFGPAILALSLALSFLVMTPLFEKAGGLSSVVENVGKGDSALLDNQFRPFLIKHASPEIVNRLTVVLRRIAPPEPEAQVSAQSTAVSGGTGPVPLAPLISAFLITELGEAFQLGFMLLIPFIVVDLLITNILMVLGVTQIGHEVVSLPLKIVLFFAVDGWALISEKLISSYMV